MAHNLVVNYGLDKKMDMLVSTLNMCDLLPADLAAAATVLQRPKRATAHEMTRFHTDEYIDFLSRVAPELAEEMTGHGTRCELLRGGGLDCTSRPRS